VGYRPDQGWAAHTVKDVNGKVITKKDGTPLYVFDKTIHDFRRTAPRNLVRAGVREGVVMTITGHKTRSVFDRYNITSTDDVAKALEAISARA